MKRIISGPCFQVAVIEIEGSGERESLEKSVTRDDFHSGIYHVADICVAVIHGVDIRIRGHRGEEADVADHIAVGADVG